MPDIRFRIGDWLADPTLDELHRADERVKVEPRAMRVLVHLAQRPGQVVSADELLEAVWPGLVVGQNSVYQTIAQLRRIFADDADAPQYIATVPRRGYRLIATVAAETPAAAPGATPASPPTSSSTPVPAAQSSEQPEGMPARGFRPAARWILALTVVALLAIAGVWSWRGSGNMPAPAVALAVLPFTSLSPGKDNQAFCDGLTEELINSLARTTSLRVTARTSAFTFREGQADARGIGARLGVTHLVEGSVRRDGARIRISAQLINASTGYQEWGESFDRPFADILDVQASIAQAVARALEVRLSAPVAPAGQPVANAYELYLLGRHQQLQRQPDSIARAIEYHRAAIALDPSFALAYAGLADAHMMGFWYANYPLEQAAVQVRENVAKALAANPELAEAYVARGRLLLESFDLLAAEQDFQRAAALNASLSEAYIGLAMVYEYRGEPRRALAPLDAAAALDPLHMVLHGRRCLALQNLGRYAEAERACARAIELQPLAPNGYWSRALIALAQGQTDTAIRGYREALAHAPDRIDLRNQLSWLYLDAGMHEDARAVQPRVPREHAEQVGIELERARWWVARNDPRGLAAHLDGLPLHASDNANDLLDAALLEIVAGRLPNARALAQRAAGNPDFNVARRIENPWLTRWGRSDGLTLAQVALAGGDRLGAEKYLGATRNYLDRLDTQGQRWHGIEYLRAGVLALEGQPEKALQSLARAVDLGWRSDWWLRADPALASLRERPAFRALVTRIETANEAARRRLESAPLIE